jgi:sporulation protein YlmC with PRC-barrel domain
MYHSIRVATVLFLGLLVAAPTLAQEPERNIIFQSHDLVGKAVKNAQNETLGNIEDYVIGKDGKMVYVAVAVGETLGFGGRLYAMPPEALKIEPNGQFFMLNATKADFEADKGFDANRWPTRADARWNKNGKGGDAAPRKDNDDMQVYRVSKIKGATVKNPRGENLGRIYEVVLELSQNRVSYVPLSFGGVLGVGAKLYAIPWDAFELKSLTLNPSERHLVLNASKQDFETAPSFDTSSFPPRADQRWKKSK